MSTALAKHLPDVDAVSPDTEAVRPNKRAIRRAGGIVRPETDVVLPDADAVHPDADATRAQLHRLAADLGLKVAVKKNGRAALTRIDGTAIEPWRENYPYWERLGKKDYQSQVRSLQIELVKLQRSVKAAGARVLVIFEGRDAAGKGGAIRRFTEHLNPRGARVVALERPAAHEQGDNYLGRYLAHLPSAGEIAFFDRSWYNRAGVEHVMGFCQPEEYARFLQDVPEFERKLVADGVQLIKFWLSVTRAEQLRRFIDRHSDPLKCWKLSPVDLASLDKWNEYMLAKDAMFAHTDLADTPWTVVKGNDKRRARLEAMRFVLSQFDYDGKQHDVVGRPDPFVVGSVAALPELPSAEQHDAVIAQIPLRRISPYSELAHAR